MKEWDTAASHCIISEAGGKKNRGKWAGNFKNKNYTKKYFYIYLRGIYLGD